MVKLVGIFSQLAPVKVAVIGDLMLDSYTIGKVSRISPEAPVAVLSVSREEQRAGGAGNVILNLLSLGAEVIPLGRLGADRAGDVLFKIFQDEGISTKGIVVDSEHPTPIKNRIIADTQQIVRVDHEVVQPLSEALELEVMQSLPSLLEGVQAIAISDYGKGFLTPKLLAAIIEYGKAKKIPTIADPKGCDYRRYAGVYMIKPNLAELYAAAKLPSSVPIDEAAALVIEETQAEVLMVTRSEEGISLFLKKSRREDFSVHIQQVRDVTGAGDSVLAMVTCALANGLELSHAVQLSNVAAGIAVSHFGCARVTLPDLARRLLQLDTSNKVFDLEHLSTLKSALDGRKVIFLSLSSLGGLTASIFHAIRRFGSREDSLLLVSIREGEPCKEFVSALATLSDVDFILLEGEHSKTLCGEIIPDEIHTLEPI